MALSGLDRRNPAGSFLRVSDVVLGSDLDSASYSLPVSAVELDLAQRRVSLLDAWL